MRKNLHTLFQFVGSSIIALTSTACGSNSTAPEPEPDPDPMFAPPTVQDASVTTLEDTQVEIELTGTSVSGASLTFTVVSGPAHGTLGSVAPGPGAPVLSATVSYTPDSDYFGPDVITVRATDGRASDEQTIAIEVTPVNDPPSFTIGADVIDSPGAGAHTIPEWITGISAGPANESGQGLTFSVESDNKALFSVQPSISPDGTLSYTPAEAGIGSATLTVSLQDDGGREEDGQDTSEKAFASVDLTFIAYATLFGPSNELAVIDIGREMVTGVLPASGRPFGVAVTPDGGTLFSSNINDDNVSVIDIASASVVATLPVGDGPRWVEVTPDGTSAWVVHSREDTFIEVDVESLTVLPGVALGDTPQMVKFTPDGSTAFVPNFFSDDLSVIDVATRTVKAPTISVGANPRALAITPDGQTLFVASEGGSGIVSVVDVETESVVDVIPAGSSPYAMAVTPDGGELWVTDQVDDNVMVIEIAPGFSSETIEVGDSGRPMALTPDGSIALVGSMGGDTISIIDVATRTVLATLPVSDRPAALAITRVSR